MKKEIKKERVGEEWLRGCDEKSAAQFVQEIISKI